MKQWPVLRDVVLFVGGLAGVLHETLFTSVDRPTLLILFAAMMGLPAVIRPGGVQDVADKVKNLADTAKDQITEGDSKDGKES